MFVSAVVGWSVSILAAVILIPLICGVIFLFCKYSIKRHRIINEDLNNSNEQRGFQFASTLVALFTFIVIFGLILYMLIASLAIANYFDASLKGSVIAYVIVMLCVSVFGILFTCFNFKSYLLSVELYAKIVPSRVFICIFDVLAVIGLFLGLIMFVNGTILIILMVLCACALITSLVLQFVAVFQNNKKLREMKKNGVSVQRENEIQRPAVEAKPVAPRKAPVRKKED